MRTIVAFAALAFAVILSVSAAGYAQDRSLSTPLPLVVPDVCDPHALTPGDYHNGCLGHGHREYHDFYKQFFTKTGKSCCSNNECRPTSVERLPNGGYGIRVDGILCPIGDRDATLFSIPGVDKVHVCASKASASMKMNGHCPAIYCIIWDLEV